MFCDKCGNKVNDDSKFCRTCGSKVLQEGEITPAVSTAQAVPVKQSVPTQSVLNDKKPVNPAKIATICALSAPIVVVLSQLLYNISGSVTSALSDWAYDIFDYEVYSVVSDVINHGTTLITGLLSIVLAIGVYLLFTMKHRAKLPLFLCLIAPGAYIFTSPIENVITSLILNEVYQYFTYAYLDFFWFDLLSGAIYLVFAVIQGIIAFFILRGVIKKILANSQSKEEKAN